MANYRVGDIIRMTRNAYGISQEELCFGICSVETLSRIENGKHNVKKKTYQQLMARMERTSEKNYSICTGKDMEILEERIILENLMLKYKYEEADICIENIKIKTSDNILNEQYIKNTEALLDYYNKRITEEELQKKLEYAIKMTVSDYEKYTEEVYPFTKQEIVILMRLANSYSRNKKEEKSIEIFEMLLRCLENGYINGEDIIFLKIAIMRNYANTFVRLDKFLEALKLIEKILKMSIENNYGHMIPIALDDIVYLNNKLHKSGQNYMNLDDMKKKNRQAYYIAAAKKDEKEKNVIKKSFEKIFNEKVELV